MNLKSLGPVLTELSSTELLEYIRKLRDQRRIKRKIKKEHTIKGKRKTASAIKRRFENLSDAEKQAIIDILSGA